MGYISALTYYLFDTRFLSAIDSTVAFSFKLYIYIILSADIKNDNE